MELISHKFIPTLEYIYICLCVLVSVLATVTALHFESNLPKPVEGITKLRTSHVIGPLFRFIPSRRVLPHACRLNAGLSFTLT